MRIHNLIRLVGQARGLSNLSSAHPLILLWALRVSNSEMSNFSQDQVKDPAPFAPCGSIFSFTHFRLALVWVTVFKPVINFELELSRGNE